MRRALLPPSLLLTMLATMTTATPTASAAADCTPTAWSVAATSSLVTTRWGAWCNTKWNVDVVLQYQDANGWHTATCQNGAACRRDKPNDGGWFLAYDEHTSLDDWNPTKPATICDHPFRVRMNFHFANGAGGITWNGTADTDPCHA